MDYRKLKKRFRAEYKNMLKQMSLSVPGFNPEVGELYFIDDDSFTNEILSKLNVNQLASILKETDEISAEMGDLSKKLESRVISREEFQSLLETVSPSSFAHLHTHTEYSLLDGANRCTNYVKTVKAMGQVAAAKTDHGNMFGTIPFYKACKEAGITPIIGIEVYVVNDMNKKEINDESDKYSHLILLCTSTEGYQNMCSIVSASWIEGFYYKPRVDHELLRKHHEGIIALSACIAGEIPKAILSNNYEKAKSIAEDYVDIFGEGNFYLEIQDHGIPAERMSNQGLMRLSQETGIKLVATNDCHYTKKEDAEAQDILMCIQMKKMVADEDRLKFDGSEFYVKSAEEMSDLFSYCPEAITNTMEVVSKCNFEFEFGKIRLPYYPIPEGFDDHVQYFRYLCETGLKERYGDELSQKHLDQLEYELGVIEKMGYIDYFLIVWDYVHWAKEHGIPVGPGRGSGAGSICAYAIGITDIDPIKYSLYFERFLNPERVSMPDFDIDFCYDRCPEVIDYVTEKYGKDRVSHIVTFMTMAARGSIKDTGKVLGYPYAEVDKISKMIPTELHMTIEKALKVSAELKAEYDNNPHCKHIIDNAMKIEGLPKSKSQHAAGILICDKAIENYAPLCTADDGSVVIQCTMTELEDLGLLKMDFLRLRNLTVIAAAEKFIHERKDPTFDITKIPLDDANVYKMLVNGKTIGVFQLESGGMVNALHDVAPMSIEDLTALISLYRPGPMDSIPEYAENKRHPDDIVYDDPKLKDILGVSYGVLVYQEQVMKIFQALAGFTLGRADIVRRAMSKKKAAVMEVEKHNFIYGLKDEETGETIIEGALARGVAEDVCDKIMTKMDDFAKYAFNKAHAACYAVISYQTAYLMYYYPVEFMAAILTSVANAKSLGYYCNGTKKALGLKLLPPNVNMSSPEFTPEGDDGIRYGLTAIKGVGLDIMTKLREEREANGPFVSLYDCCVRMAGQNWNKKAIDALVKAGAFDWTGHNRSEMSAVAESFVSMAKAESKNNASGQMSLFDLMSSEEKQKYAEPKMPTLPEWDQLTKLKFEKEAASVYISGHPLDHYQTTVGMPGIASIYEIVDSLTESHDGTYESGQYVKIIGVLSSVEHKISKTGNPMSLFNVEDNDSEIGCIAFKKCVEKCKSLLEDDAVVLLDGKIDVRDDGSIQLMVNDVKIVPKDTDDENMLNDFKKSIAPKKGYQRKQMQNQYQSKPIVKNNAQTVYDKYGKAVYIKIQKVADIEPLIKIVCQAPGTLQVVFCCLEDGKVYTNPSLKVNMSSGPVAKQIRDYVGTGNIKLIN